MNPLGRRPSAYPYVRLRLDLIFAIGFLRVARAEQTSRAAGSPAKDVSLLASAIGAWFGRFSCFFESLFDVQTFTDIEQMRSWCQDRMRSHSTLGLVPTMGALHEGHLSLMRQAKQSCDDCVATIFVNPTQFAAGEDLDQYPRPLEQDLTLLESVGVDAVFLPTETIMYPEGFGTHVTPPPIALPLEGRSRPDHFRGVTTVVMKLFQIIPAQRAFFGQKDFQQLRVIEDMTRDLNVPTEIVRCEIVRDPDGLAMSSRNRYLSEDQRRRGRSLSRALARAESLFQSGQEQVHEIEAAMRSEMRECDSIDYAVIVNQSTLTAPEDGLVRNGHCVALLAARLGSTRLIDNQIL